jgi:hypothetical protein
VHHVTGCFDGAFKQVALRVQRDLKFTACRVRREIAQRVYDLAAWLVKHRVKDALPAFSLTTR